MTTLEILKNGRDALAANGLCQGLLTDERGQICSLGALMMGSGVAKENLLRGVTVNWPDPDLMAALERGLGGNICLFNNIHSEDEVLAAWDRAIALEEKAQELTFA
jgi:hypothetical protein